MTTIRIKVDDNAATAKMTTSRIQPRLGYFIGLIDIIIEKFSNIIGNKIFSVNCLWKLIKIIPFIKSLMINGSR